MRRSVVSLIASIVLLSPIATLLGGPAGDLPVIRADGDLLTVDGKPIFLKGVAYQPYIAGDAPWTGVMHVDFQKDLMEIKNDLHANAVRVYNPLPRGFYDAAREAGIWVLQGFFIPDSDNLLDPQFLGDRRRELQDAVDLLLRDYGAGDVILAYVIGSGLQPRSIAETVERNQAHPRYQGVHYSVPAATRRPRSDPYPDCPAPLQACDPPLTEFPDTHPFQSFLAELADAMAVHESESYAQRHLIGHAATAATNVFLGARDRPDGCRGLPVDLSFLDIIFENLFTYNHPYITHMGFPDYLRRLKSAYPSRPVVVLETGYSTSVARFPVAGPLCGFRNQNPLPTTFAFGGASEDEQALGIEARWMDVTCSSLPLAGFFVFEYYEQWWYIPEINVQNNQPLEYFGLKRVRGTPQNFQVTNKPAFDTVAELYGCGPEGDPADCGLVIRTPRLLTATYRKDVSKSVDAFTASGGTPPYSWEVLDAGALPPGISLDSSTGTLGGKPERVGTFRFRLRVEDAGGTPLEREAPMCLRVGPPHFSVDGRQLLMGDEPFFLKGIDYGPFIAGDAPWTDVNHADPSEDLREIREELGANAIRVYQTLPRDVYDAARENGIFVIQGIHLQIDCSRPGETVECPHPGQPECLDPQVGTQPQLDLLRPDFLQTLRAHVTREIDEIHSAGANDVILAYAIGNEINFCTTRFTILEHQESPRYQGEYYSAPPPPANLPALDQYPGCPQQVGRFWDPHPVQSFIAELVDVAARREVEHYGRHHLMGHASDPRMTITLGAKDILQPDVFFPVDFGFLDIVFQNVYAYFPPHVRFVGYREYLLAARETYSVPFVILECGYSVSLRLPGDTFCANGALCGQGEPPNDPQPRPFSFCFGRNSEEEQAQGIWEQYRTASSEELAAGFFVFEYADEWWKAGNEDCQDETQPEEYFGIKSVTRDVACEDDPEHRLDGFTIRERLAFETVGRMFDRSWCPASEQLVCTPVPGGVRLTIGSAESFDSIRILRDGTLVAELDSGELSYTDTAASLGVHEYSLVITQAYVECPVIKVTCEVRDDVPFRRGDTDTNGRMELTDAIGVFNFLFITGVPPLCFDAADGDDNGAIELTDGIRILNVLFLGFGTIPEPGFMECGEDPSKDDFQPCVYDGCL